MNFFARKFPTVFFYTNFLKIITEAFIKLITGRYNWDTYVFYSKKILDLVEKCGTKIKIEGVEELKKVTPPVVIVSNHMSSLETFIFGYVIGQQLKISFIVKNTLLKYPIFGQILKFLRPIGIKRKQPKKDFKIIIENLRKLFDEKISIVVFPQATRSDIIDERNFNSLGVKLAKIFNVGLLPVCVKTDFLSIGKIVRDIGRVYPEKNVYIKIFPLVKRVDKTTHRQVVELLKFTLNQWRCKN